MPTAAESTLLIASAATTDAIPTIEPTETSMPPEMMTTVCAIATMPRIVIALRIAVKLRGEKNASGRSEPKMATRTSSATRRLRFCGPMAFRRRRTGWLRVGDMAAVAGASEVAFSISSPLEVTRHDFAEHRFFAGALGVQRGGDAAGLKTDDAIREA